MPNYQRHQSRRQFVRATTAGAAILPFAAAGATSGAAARTQEDDATIRLNNGTFDVEVDPTESSHGWKYDGTSTLYLERYALRWGDSHFSTGRVTQVETGYGTDEGSPGEWYGARSRPGYGDISVDRFVRLDPQEPVLDVVYRVRNGDDSLVENVEFRQYVDYDIGARWDDVGTYDESQEIYRHRQSADGGVVAGFTGSFEPSGGGVSGGDRIQNDQTETSREGDVKATMRWNLGAIEPGESASVSVRFAAADTATRLDELLAGNLPDPERYDFELDGRDTEPDGDQRDGSNTADGGTESDGDTRSAGNRSADASNGDSGDALPGPGIVGAVLGIGGGGYLLGRGGDE